VPSSVTPVNNPKIIDRVQRNNGAGGQGVVKKMLKKRTMVEVYWGTSDGEERSTIEKTSDLTVCPPLQPKPVTPS
jgi:hypothetical protein